jgi:hypothetical protein
MALPLALVWSVAISILPAVVSSTLRRGPGASWMLRMTLPPGPMMSRILSVLIWIVVMRGAWATARRGAPR